MSGTPEGNIYDLPDHVNDREDVQNDTRMHNVPTDVTEDSCETFYRDYVLSARSRQPIRASEVRDNQHDVDDDR